MNSRILPLRRISLAISLSLIMVNTSVQGAEANGEAADYVQPMTTWGEPDLRGTWPINHLIGVPLVRPPEFGDQAFLTDEEFAEKQASVAARDDRFQSGAIPLADAAGRAMRQTSLIVDPPDVMVNILSSPNTENNCKPICVVPIIRRKPFSIPLRISVPGTAALLVVCRYPCRRVTTTMAYAFFNHPVMS